MSCPADGWKATVMVPDEILRHMEEQWKQGGEFTDVEAMFWHPERGPERLEHCPTCGEVLEPFSDRPHGWERVSDRPMYLQARCCVDHGFARIYVIPWTDLKKSKWDLNNDAPN